MLRTVLRKSALFLLCGLMPLVLFAGLMLHTETTIGVPQPNETVMLERLAYKSRRFEAKVTSVRLVWKSEEGADPRLAEWIFTGFNTDGQVHRLEMQIRLLDAEGKQIGWFTGKHPLAAGSSNQAFSVRMKVAPDDWSAAKKIRIFADWIS